MFPRREMKGKTLGERMLGPEKTFIQDSGRGP